MAPVVVWENPNPTVNFAEHYLDVDFTGCIYYEIEYRYSASSALTFSTGKIDCGRDARTVTVATNVGSGGSIATRDFNFNNKYFSAGTSQAFNASSGSKADNRNIPIKILGYKS